MTIKIDDTIPDLTLLDQTEQPVNLASYFRENNKIAVIFFYPKDETTGCIKEVCGFRDSYSDIQAEGAEVVGISSDDPDSHQAFAKHYDLPYKLLSDPDNKARKAFGVPGSIFGLIPGRVTYIFDQRSKLQKTYRSQLKPVSHIKEALEQIKRLK